MSYGHYPLLKLFVLWHFRREIDYYCVVHESGNGLYAYSKGRPEGGSRVPLPCDDALLEKINDLRVDFGLHDETKMMVMLSLATKDMNRYVAMYPEVWFIDCTAGKFVIVFDTSWSMLLVD